MKRSRSGFIIEREKEPLSLNHQGERFQEVCLLVGGDPVGREFVGVVWGTSESTASGTAGGFVTFGLLGGSLINAG
jgi:hypothetical protein